MHILTSHLLTSQNSLSLLWRGSASGSPVLQKRNPRDGKMRKDFGSTVATHGRFVQKSGGVSELQIKACESLDKSPSLYLGKIYLLPSIWFSREINAISPLRIRAQFSKTLSHWLIDVRSTPFGTPSPHIPQHVSRIAHDARCSFPGPGGPVLTAQKQFFSLLLQSAFL